MSFFEKLRSLFGKSVGQKIHDETLKFRGCASLFVLPISMRYGLFKPMNWILDEPQYAANYMLGFASELTKGFGEKLWASYAYMVAWHIFIGLTDDDETGMSESEKRGVLKPFLEYVQSNQIEDDMAAFEDGAADGEWFSGGGQTPKSLNHHFESAAKKQF